VLTHRLGSARKLVREAGNAGRSSRTQWSSGTFPTLVPVGRGDAPPSRRAARARPPLKLEPWYKSCHPGKSLRARAARPVEALGHTPNFPAADDRAESWTAVPFGINTPTELGGRIHDEFDPKDQNERASTSFRLTGTAPRAAGRWVESEVGELCSDSRSVRSREAVPSAHFSPALPVLWLACAVQLHWFCCPY